MKFPLAMPNPPSVEQNDHSHLQQTEAKTGKQREFCLGLFKGSGSVLELLEVCGMQWDCLIDGVFYSATVRLQLSLITPLNGESLAQNHLNFPSFLCSFLEK